MYPGINPAPYYILNCVVYIYYDGGSYLTWDVWKTRCTQFSIVKALVSHYILPAVMYGCKISHMETWRFFSISV